jgi:hypothetical protein
MPNPVGFEFQSLASGVVGLLASVPTTADSFRVRVELASCRWLSSATPNASVGLLITPGDAPMHFALASPAQFKLFPLVAAQFTVQYFAGSDQYKL